MFRHRHLHGRCHGRQPRRHCRLQSCFRLRFPQRHHHGPLHRHRRRGQHRVLQFPCHRQRQREAVDCLPDHQPEAQRRGPVLGPSEFCGHRYGQLRGGQHGLQDRRHGNHLAARFPVGTTTVTCTATDGSGNSSSCSFPVTVTDTEAPKPNCPARISVPTDGGQCSASVRFAAAPTDNCGVASTVYKIGTTVISSPYAFPVGTNQVDVTVTDVNNNTASCSFEVVVLL